MVSDKAKSALNILLNGGKSEEIVVANCLKGIASNDDYQSTDEFLVTAAEEIRNAADWFIKRLKP